uniref:RenK n=1 Tax=Candidatus Endohaliclona renieramycinifaciens TaxID=2565582 RepID=A0A4D6G3I9_9GAMM|nr:RenK [Candidatus Endohaliclona renieramycinifaciens]
MEIFQFLENKDLRDLDDLVSILQFRALHQPQEEAFTFLSDGGRGLPATLVNYGELDQSAKSIATFLQRKIEPGEKALLFYTPGPEYIKALFSCLYAGIVAVPVHASHHQALSRNPASLLSIVQDAEVKMILSDSSSLGLVDKIVKEIPELGKDCSIATDTITDEAGYLKPNLTRTTSAIIQYTSGSTSTPKGVILSHSNLLTNIKAILCYLSVRPSSRGVIWLPPYHDMGLIGGIFTPIVGGFPVTLMSPVSFIQDPLFWLKTITSYKGTISGGPNFAFDYCIKRMNKRPCDNLDLSSWKIAFCGAEPINPNTIDNFIKTFSPFGLSRDAFQACYGLAESSLMVTTCLASNQKQKKSRYFYSIDHKKYELNMHEFNNETDNKNIHRLVSCGSVIEQHELKIVDPVNRVNIRDGTVGEVWIRGPSVAAGYWNKSKETQETFNATLAQDQDKTQNKWLRTGDLGFLYKNELFVTGRLKELIIIRGYNYYPHDIEYTSKCSHPRLDNYPSAVFSVVGNSSKEHVIIIQEVPKRYSESDLQEILASIQKSVTEKHNLFTTEIVLVKAGSIPKTSSGKIKRIACKEQYLSETLDVLINLKNNADSLYTNPYEGENPADVSRLMSYLKEEVMKNTFKLSAMLVKDRARLTDLGIDSLGLVELKHHIDQDLNVEIDLAFLLRNPTLVEFAYYLVSKLNKNVADTTDIMKEECTQLALTDSQKGMWFLNQLIPHSSAQTITRAIQINGPLDTVAFIQSLEIIIQRHPSLRSTFSSKESEPFQFFHKNVLPETIQIREAQLWNEQKLETELINMAYKPFNLKEGPLLRFIIFYCSENKFILLFSAHHIILDFWSFSILFEELFKLYVAKMSVDQKIELPSIVHPKTYFEWYRNYSKSPEFENDWQYWKEELAGPLPQLKLRRKSVEGNSAERYNFQINKLISEKVEEYSKKSQTTPYVILLATFYAFLYRLTKQDNIVVGSPVATRNWPGGDQVVGYCVNMLPLLVHLSEDLDFVSLTKKVKNKVHSAMKHQNFPFSLMVEKLKISRQEDHRPIFNIAFMYQKKSSTKSSTLFKDLAKIAVNGEPTEILFEDLTLKLLPIKPLDIQFEIIFSITPTNEGFFCSMEYETQTMDRELARVTSLEYSNFLEKLVDFDQQSISQYPLLFEEVFSNSLILDQNATEVTGVGVLQPHIAPRNAVEVQIAEIWENLSRKSNIGIYDNFFELGGSSLLSIKLANQLSNAFHIHIDVSKIFEFQTVAGLAEYIQNYCKVTDLSDDSLPIKKIDRVPYLSKSFK